MNSPDALQNKLFKQWQQASLRVCRLLEAEQWPLTFAIGKPTNRQVAQQSQAVSEHIQAWQQVSVGKVVWQEQSFQSLAQPLSVPVSWELSKPSEWVAAINQHEVNDEFSLLDQVLINAPPAFHEILIRKRHLWRGKTAQQVSRCIALAVELKPGAAQGKPLRAMAGFDVDTKFFERNEKLITALLDERFAGEASSQGLAVFLDAKPEDDHWLLVVPLQEGLLPFPRMRLSTKQLAQYELPAKTIIIVENERCEYLLPSLENSIAILGAGLNLSWLAAQSLASKQVLYWGDIDTWGFQMLAAARRARPEMESILMDPATFEQCKSKSAVVEPVQAENFNLQTLTQEEQRFYHALQSMEKGRLEQEFIPAEKVARELGASLQVNKPKSASNQPAGEQL